MYIPSLEYNNNYNDDGVLILFTCLKALHYNVAATKVKPNAKTNFINCKPM